MFDWDEGDRFSFEDSDRFEEDSLCSWISEPESSCNNWRGWKKQNGNNCGAYHVPHSKNKGNHFSIMFSIISSQKLMNSIVVLSHYYLSLLSCTKEIIHSSCIILIRQSKFKFKITF